MLLHALMEKRPQTSMTQAVFKGPTRHIWKKAWILRCPMFWEVIPKLWKIARGSLWRHLFWEPQQTPLSVAGAKSGLTKCAQSEAKISPWPNQRAPLFWEPEETPPLLAPSLAREMVPLHVRSISNAWVHCWYQVDSKRGVCVQWN